ncbi:unnamed protein product [Aspergillus oryzae]|nr:unnamed protein product [Aspergillus oryzae]GMF94378.1 unnamed protein product [Aspergillus oryzae]
MWLTSRRSSNNPSSNNESSNNESSNNESSNNESSNNESSNNESSNNESSNNESSNNLSSNNLSSDDLSSNNQSSDSARVSGYETPNTDPLFTRYAEDSDYYRSFVEKLLDLVCNEDQETVARLVSIIRSGASQREILAVISEMQNGNNHFGENGVTGS